MPDLERRGQQAVALPMADILAEARLPSPWDGLSGQADFDEALARGIDDLEPIERVRACNRIAGATDQERRGLMTIATYGWSTWASYGSLAQDMGLTLKDFSGLMGRLKKKDLVRETTIYLSEGRRLRFITISGERLLRAFRPAVHDFQTAAHNGPGDPENPQSEISTRSPKFQPAVRKSRSAQLGAVRNFDPQSEISPYVTLVSSYTDTETDFEQRQTNVPSGENPSAVPDFRTAPSWWGRFEAHVQRIPAPTPKSQPWPTLASLIDAELDPGADVLREACGRFLETYSKPKHIPVRSLRGVVRNIYRGLLAELADGTSSIAWASDSWFADQPDPQEEPEREYSPFAWDGAADPEAQRIWVRVLEKLGGVLPKPTFQTWIRPTEGVAMDQYTFTVAAPTPFAAEWLERRMSHALSRELEQAAGRPLELRLVVRSRGNRPDPG